MLDKDGYRPNVGIVLANGRDEVFWGKRVNQHAWQFPQGGIKHGESPEQAMYRELEEETGLAPVGLPANQDPGWATGTGVSQYGQTCQSGSSGAAQCGHGPRGGGDGTGADAICLPRAAYPTTRPTCVTPGSASTAQPPTGCIESWTPELNLTRTVLTFAPTLTTTALPPAAPRPNTVEATGKTQFALGGFISASAVT